MSEIQMGTIQWFPGHMTKTRRMIAANLSLVDAVVEILDARIPSSSQNPEMQRLVKEKPRMLLLNKADMADRMPQLVGCSTTRSKTCLPCRWTARPERASSNLSRWYATSC